MRAQEWKTVRMVLDIHQCNSPPANGVALLAIDSQPAAMKVCMTISALFPDTGKYQFGVALPAVKPRMHSAKRE